MYDTRCKMHVDGLVCSQQSIDLKTITASSASTYRHATLMMTTHATHTSHMVTASLARSHLLISGSSLSRARPLHPLDAEVLADDPLHLVRHLLRREVLAEVLEELAVGAHEVEEDGVVHQVVLLVAGRGAEVDAEGLGHLGDVLIAPREADEPRVVVLLVRVEALGRVALGVDRDEHGLHGGDAVGLVHHVEGAAHLLELRGADVRALGEAEVQQHVLAVEVAALARLARRRVHQAVRPPEHRRPGHGHLGLREHALLLVVVVQHDACAGSHHRGHTLPVRPPQPPWGRAAAAPAPAPGLLRGEEAFPERREGL
mmetsp:Transcript_12639/g.24660  ORF Transcript_12639/g.24660 Transcript_12639/m.24660 type:complete len:315 (-) Transcript_12639:60-1004(-)